ncbi:MAG TPA: hypothetical protein VJ909_02125 [Prolixibacteraceae bacterium]|nr:hypothetical protein [Prolixibacteraceae bacterium]
MKKSSVLNIILAAFILLLLLKINFQSNSPDKSTGVDDSFKNKSANDITQNNKITHTHQAWVKLTVSESKRLIAKGLVKYPPVVEKLKSGKIIIARGTTNTYIAEEIMNDTIVPGAFVTGRISPAKGKGLKVFRNKISEIVIENGKRKDVAFTKAMDAANNFDIVLKGANIINYSDKKAAVFVGSPTGGTIGHILPRLKNDRLRLIVPVGLEKNNSANLVDVSNKLHQQLQNINKKVPGLWLLPGDLFTEIEAIKQFADVDVFQIGAGGIAGAEGAVVLAIRGEENEVNKALKIIEEVHGEPAFK